MSALTGAIQRRRGIQLVHWPTIQLALGAIVDGSKAPPDENGTQEQEHQVRVRAMPCTTARLKGNQRGEKMVDFCLFVEPQNEDLAKLIELWKHPRLDYNINHTDYYPLRQRPVVLGAESKKPGGGIKEAHVRLLLSLPPTVILTDSRS